MWQVFAPIDTAAGKIGLTGLWVQPDIDFDAYYRIIDNTSTVIFVDDHDNQFLTVANSGDTYEGRGFAPKCICSQ